MAKETKTIHQDGRTYQFTPGKGGKLISPSRRIGKPGLLGTYEPNPIKSKSVPTPLVPGKKNMRSVPGSTRGSLMNPFKKGRDKFVGAFTSRNLY